jgi:MFS family permease
MLEPDTAAESSAVAAAPPDGAQPGVVGLLRVPAFRGLALTTVLSSLAFGSSRFVFVWLIGELTEWNTATAILGIVIGMPPLLLSAWAGSLADHLDPKRLGTALFLVTAVSFAGTAVLVDIDVMTVPLAMVCAFVTAIGPAMSMPVLQALVPAVVPSSRLMQAVAIQNLGMMVSMIVGSFIVGAIIQGFGVAAGFWFLAAAGLLGTVRYAITDLPHRMAGATADRRGAIREGAVHALRTEPIRSLLALTVVVGIAISASTLMIPELARDVLGKESFAAGALNACMGLGMMITSFVLATRWTPVRPGLVLVLMMSVSIGGGLVAIGASRVYLLTAIFAFLWGAAGGVVMTLLRTLTQLNTPPELMGRVMGLSAMAQNGSFPIGSVLLAALVAATSITTATVLSGVVCAVCVWAVAVRPHVRSL